MLEILPANPNKSLLTHHSFSKLTGFNSKAIGANWEGMVVDTKSGSKLLIEVDSHPEMSLVRFIESNSPVPWDIRRSARLNEDSWRIYLYQDKLVYSREQSRREGSIIDSARTPAFIFESGRRVPLLQITFCLNKITLPDTRGMSIPLTVGDIDSNKTWKEWVYEGKPFESYSAGLSFVLQLKRVVDLATPVPMAMDRTDDIDGQR